MSEISKLNIPDPERTAYDEDNRVFKEGFENLVKRLGSKRAAIGFILNAVPGLGEAVVENLLNTSFFPREVPSPNIRAKILKAMNLVLDSELNSFLNTHPEFKAPIRSPLNPKPEKEKKSILSKKIKKI